MTETAPAVEVPREPPAETPAETSPPETPPVDKDRRVLTALLVAAVVGAVALPLWRVGIGWPICAVALLGVVLAARSAHGATAPTGGAERAWPVAAGVAAVVFSVVPAVRASGPLTAISLLAALVLASYALTGGRGWGDLLVAATALVPAAFRGLGWTASGTTSGTTSRVPGAGRITLGALAGLALLLVFGTLLRAADPVFADLLDSSADDLSAVDLVRVGLGAVAWLGIALAELVRTPAVRPEVRPVRRALAGAGWVIPVALLDALFAVFVLVQLTVLFGGNEHVLGAGGPDYAVYAKGGFVQLGVVTALTLAVVGILATFARRDSTMDLGLIRALGGLLCGLTLVIVASALKRLSLYADAYGFTWPRLLGFAGEVWGLIFVLLLAAGVRLRAGWLPRAIAAAATGVLLALAAVNPEALMAQTTLDRYATPYPVDLRYVASLSPDALDGIDTIPPGRFRDCLLAGFERQLRDPDPWYGLNLAREQARARLATTDPYC